MAYVAAIDIGGTHTDCVASDGRAVHSAKVPTTEDPTDGVINGLEMLAGKFGTDLAALLGACDRFVYGSTTATNIFVQRRLPKTGLLCTHGHRDILWFREGNKPDRWNLRTPPPWSLLDRHLRRPVRERVDQAGDVIVPLEEQDVREAAGTAAGRGGRGGRHRLPLVVPQPGARAPRPGNRARGAGRRRPGARQRRHPARDPRVGAHLLHRAQRGDHGGGPRASGELPRPHERARPSRASRW